MYTQIESRANASFDPVQRAAGPHVNSLRREERDDAHDLCDTSDNHMNAMLDEDLDKPMAFVYHPARNPMQSGPRARNRVQQMDPQQPLNIEPLKGWTGGDDPSRNIPIEFSSR